MPHFRDTLLKEAQKLILNKFGDVAMLKTTAKTKRRNIVESK